MSKVKLFDSKKYQVIIKRIRKNTSPRRIEELCSKIAIGILVDHEGFKRIEKGPDFVGTPFDFFGYKNKTPYIIELKASLRSFNLPSETQRKRMRTILNKFRILNVALLQMKIKEGTYKILYNEELKRLFRKKDAPYSLIEEWISKRIAKT